MHHPTPSSDFDKSREIPACKPTQYFVSNTAPEPISYNIAAGWLLHPISRAPLKCRFQLLFHDNMEPSSAPHLALCHYSISQDAPSTLFACSDLLSPRRLDPFGPFHFVDIEYVRTETGKECKVKPKSEP